MSSEEVYDASEQDEIISIFADMLWKATKDGGKKRASGEKPPWDVDPSHEAAMFSHLNKWKHGELHDPDSNAHPLVHLAWRALAIAYQEGRDEYLEQGGATPDSGSGEVLETDGGRGTGRHVDFPDWVARHSGKSSPYHLQPNRGSA